LHSHKLQHNLHNLHNLNNLHNLHKNQHHKQFLCKMLDLKLLQFLNLHQFLNNQLLNQLNNLRKAKVDSSED
jgi:hypothetical protein